MQRRDGVGCDGHDIWSVNVEAEYHEEKAIDLREGGTGRDAPILPRQTVVLPEAEEAERSAS